MKQRGFIVLLIIVFLLMFGCTKTKNKNYLFNGNGEFVVTFDGNGGTLVSGKQVQRVTSSSEIEPPIYERSGYIFEKWDTNILNITNDSFVKAIWKEVRLNGTDLLLSGYKKIDENTFYKEVDNNVDFVSLLNSVTVSEESVWHLFSDEKLINELNGKSFSCVEGLNIVYLMVTSKDGKYKIYNIEVKRLKIFTVSFRTYGSYIEDQFIQENSCAIEPEAPRRTGYEFDRWNFDFTTAITDNLIITANWIPIDYHITLDVNGGEDLLSDSLTVTMDSVIDLPIPSRTGYSFNGWFNDGVIYKETTWRRTSDIHLIAEWKANSYPVTLSQVSTINHYYITYITGKYDDRANGTRTKVEIFQGQEIVYPFEPSGVAYTGSYSGITYTYMFVGWIVSNKEWGQSNSDPLYFFDGEITDNIYVTAIYDYCLKYGDGAVAGSDNSGYNLNLNEKRNITSGYGTKMCFGTLYEGKYTIELEASEEIELEYSLRDYNQWYPNDGIVYEKGKVKSIIEGGKNIVRIEANLPEANTCCLEIKNYVHPTSVIVIPSELNSSAFLSNDITPSISITYDSGFDLGIPYIIPDEKEFIGWFTEPDGSGDRLTDSTGKSLGKWKYDGPINVYAVFS